MGERVKGTPGCVRQRTGAICDGRVIGSEGCRQGFGLHRNGGPGLMQGCEVGSEVGDPWAMQDGRTKCGGFPRVMAVGRTKGAADQDRDRAEAIPKAHLAEGIDDPDVGGRPMPFAAQGGRQAMFGGAGGDLGPAVRVTGGNQDSGQRVGRAEGRQKNRLILRVGGGKEHRLSADERRPRFG